MQRRQFLKAATATSLSTVAVTELSACARSSAALAKTKPDAEGPFYPVEPIPLENNLLLESSVVGEPLLFTGRVVNTSSKALADVRVEIWQCDGNSVYRHPKAPQPAAQDPAFKGFGAALTDQSGAFTFNTIVPVPYPGRPPHIHVKLKQSDETFLPRKSICMASVALMSANSPQRKPMTAMRHFSK